MHVQIDPAILYFGTPVVLVSSTNEDGSANLAPISSAWWLGKSCLLGFGASSKTPGNILRTGECVLNLPSVHQVGAVDRLARLTGSNPIPPHKQAMGYCYEKEKFEVAGLTPRPSATVAAPRVLECPVQLEATLAGCFRLAEGDPQRQGRLVALETRIERVHIDESLRLEGHSDRIDPVKWRPLIMSFCQFFGLGPIIYPSTLAQIPESAYRPPAPRQEAAAMKGAA
ncbi:MAG: flavin reductase family protein [Acidobacteria bacterium]|nr:flavin reductase family protein [Acidobacteriota bacterium]